MNRLPYAIALSAILTITTLSAKDYHVATTGSDKNAGTQSAPFKTISAAARIAQPGDVVTVHEGVYRERVNPPQGGSSDQQRIVYQAASGETVVIKGSEILKGWKNVEGDTWMVTLPNTFFGAFNPYNDVIRGEWYIKKGYDRHTGAIYFNGTWLDEAKTVTHVMAPTKGRWLWKAKVDETSTTIWAQFKNADPNKELVEINVRRSVFYPDQPGQNYITVRGFVMRHAATPWAGAMSEQIGLLGTHWSKGWIIEDNEISHSVCTGISLGRYGLKDEPMPAATAPGYVESIKLALKHGWSKETIGSHVVRNNHISHCEKNGIHGSLGGIFSLIEGNSIHDIATRGWLGGHDIAGLKLLGSHDTTIRDNYIYRCQGRCGIWLDWMAQGTHVTGNLMHDNSNDLYMEVNHGPYLIDNNLFLSSHSLRDWSQGGAYAHNLLAGSVEYRHEPKRHTPYFAPHSTKAMKISGLMKGDAQFYNNVFAGRDGLAEYKSKGGLPKVAGNMVLKGKIGKVKVRVEKDSVWLEMPTGADKAPQEARRIVTSELLGKAKVPDAPYVKPDGSAYRLDTDYFGKKRSEENPSAGPFQLQGQAGTKIKVWPK